jgi:hypothetical protein
MDHQEHQIDPHGNQQNAAGKRSSRQQSNEERRNGGYIPFPSPAAEANSALAAAGSRGSSPFYLSARGSGGNSLFDLSYLLLVHPIARRRAA